MERPASIVESRSLRIPERWRSHRTERHDAVPPSDKLILFTRQSPRMARKRMYFSVERAVRAFGLRRTPAEQVLHEAGFVVHGYAPAPPAYRTRAR
jgi:hypothetical protein